jgi:hypothetical protein
MKTKITNEFDRERVIGYVKRLDLSRPYTVEIVQRKAKRSIDQNRLYWMWLTCIETETGNDRNDLHEYFKQKFIQPETVVIFGETQTKHTTTDKSTAQFKEYLDKIQAFAASELAITLPDPDDKHWEEFVEFYRDKL